MGGKLFNTNRVSTEELNLIKEVVRQRLPDYTYHFTRCTKDKVDHGDLDVVIQTSDKPKGFTKEHIVKDILDKFNVTRSYSNGPMLSIEYSGFQIDFIFRNEKEYEMQCLLSDYSPFCTLIGKMAHRYGMKMSHEGLKYITKIGDRPHYTVLSKDPKKIFNFFGYDLDKFKDFVTREAVYDYILASPYCHHDVFRLYKMNAKERNRHRNRKEYVQFLDYLETVPDNTSKKFIHKKNIQKEFDVDVEAVDTYYQMLHYNSNRVKELYNGKTVSRLIGLEGKELGKFMQFVRDLHGGNEELHKFIIKVDAYVNTYVKVWYEHFKTQQ